MSRVGLMHHVELYVSDLRRSSEFWGWFLSSLGYERAAQTRGDGSVLGQAPVCGRP